MPKNKSEPNVNVPLGEVPIIEGLSCDNCLIGGGHPESPSCPKFQAGSECIILKDINKKFDKIDFTTTEGLEQLTGIALKRLMKFGEFKEFLLLNLGRFGEEKAAFTEMTGTHNLLKLLLDIQYKKEKIAKEDDNSTAFLPDPIKNKEKKD